MIYKPSSCNYFTLSEKELLIVNFLKGISSFRVVTGNDVDLVKNYLSISLLDIKNPNALEKMLIDNGFLIPENYDEDSEIEMLQLDYIYNSKLRIVVHVTKDCNFRCKYCFIDFENKKMDLLIQDKIIDYIRMNISKYSGVYISWFGGEPLLGMDVITHISEEVIKICKRAKKPYVAGITTNGYLLKPETIEKLISLKVYNYCITLDGLKETHDAQRVLTNGKSSYDHIIENLRYIKEKVSFRFLNICLRTNFTKQSLDQIDEYLLFLETEFGKDPRFVVLFKLASDWGGDRIESIRQNLLTPKSYATIYNSMIESNTSLCLDNLTSLFWGGMTCDAVRRNKYTISVDGQIAKCDTVCEETIIGYIDSTGWHFDYEAEARWLTVYKKGTDECSNCVFKCMCFQGTCPKKKLLNPPQGTCPKPIFMDLLMLIYKKCFMKCEA